MDHSISPSSNGKCWLALGSLPIFALVFLITFLFFDVHLTPITISWPGFGNGGGQSITNTSSAAAAARFSLIGISTIPNAYHQRHFLRTVYALQQFSSPHAEIDVRFVFCNLSKPEDHFYIAMEILHYNDIITLNCTENMNNGKTYTYFSSLPSILPRRYHYVMKTDDDSYIGLAHLAASLSPLPRKDLYYGSEVCRQDEIAVPYMLGMGYVLSWDIVEWISTAKIPKIDKEGPEDLLVALWMKKWKKGKNRVSAKPGMYDFPGLYNFTGTKNERVPCCHELIPNTTVLHSLKAWYMWWEALKYFNFTKGFQPSKLYYVDADIYS